VTFSAFFILFLYRHILNNKHVILLSEEIKKLMLKILKRTRQLPYFLYPVPAILTEIIVKLSLKLINKDLDMVVHTYNSSTQGTEAGGA
jgi:hypothetical protein